MRKYLREQRRNKMSLLEKFDEELKDIQKITEEQVKEKLEYLVNSPVTYPGYDLAFNGFFHLMKKCETNKEDQRFREAVYKRVIKMLETELEQSDEMAISFQMDYAGSLLSSFMEPEIPKEYALRLYPAFLAGTQRYFKRKGRENKIDMFILEKIKEIIEAS